jgi:hypothetical protein
VEAAAHVDVIGRQEELEALDGIMRRSAGNADYARLAVARIGL